MCIHQMCPLLPFVELSPRSGIFELMTESWNCKLSDRKKQPWRGRWRLRRSYSCWRSSGSWADHRARPGHWRAETHRQFREEMMRIAEYLLQIRAPHSRPLWPPHCCQTPDIGCRNFQSPTLRLEQEQNPWHRIANIQQFPNLRTVNTRAWNEG